VTSFVRTVLGDVPAGEVGRTNYHEHLFQVTPLLPGDELDDEQCSRDEAGLLRDSGFEALVDATPTGLGRNPAALARISASQNLHVVAATGAHRVAHYGSAHWLRDLSEEQLGARFSADLFEGMPVSDGPERRAIALAPGGQPVRAGILKAGIGYWSISTFERRVLAGVAEAHARTGAPVMVHLEHGSAALELLDLLASCGVKAESVVLAHIDRNPDPVLHAELAAAGAYLGYDGFARTRTGPDTTLIECLLRTAALGGEDRLLLGGDVARRTRYVAYGGMPGLAYLGHRVVPRLIRAGQAGLVHKVLVDNPARLLGRGGLVPEVGKGQR